MGRVILGALALWVWAIGIALAQGPIIHHRSIELYDGNGRPEIEGQMDRLAIQRGQVIQQPTAGGILLDTTAWKQAMGGYFAIVPNLNHTDGFTITLSISTTMQHQTIPLARALTFVANSYDPDLDQHRTLDISLWQNGITVNGDEPEYQAFEARHRAPQKTYEIVIKGNDCSTWVNGEPYRLCRLIDGSQGDRRNDFGINPYIWPGWVWFGDDTLHRTTKAEFQYLRIDYHVSGKSGYWLPAVSK